MSTSSTSAPRPLPNREPSGAGGGAEVLLVAGEENILAKGRLLYPERGPSRFAARVARAALEELGRAGPGRLLLLPSPGLWYGLAELIEGLPPDAALLCLETDPALAALSRARMPPKFASHPRLRFVEGRDPRAWLAAAEALGTFRRCLPVRLSGGGALDEECYREAQGLLDEAFSARWRNKASLAAMGRLWTRNIFRNLSRLKELEPGSLPRFEGACVVCGAGPSLETALPLIRRERPRLGVLAADTALPSLLSAGIRPDLVVCLEAQVWNLRDFIGSAGESFPLLVDLSSHPSSLRLPGARPVLSSVLIEEGAFLRRLRASGLPLLTLPPLGSVGVQALHLARALCSGPLLLAGLDFAFVAGKTHARGSPALGAELAAATRLLPAGMRGLAAAYREGVRELGGGLLGDPVLSRYAALAAEEVEDSASPVYDLRGGRGLPLGALPFSAEVLGEPEEGAGGARRGSGASVSGIAPPERSLLGALGRRFLGAELDRLLALEAGLRRGAMEREELKAAIAELDYLLWPLPDAERLAGLPQDLLNRILVEVEYWLAVLGELATASRSR